MIFMAVGTRISPRRVLLWALLAPFLLMSLFAPGVMLDRAADGGLTLVICSGGGTAEVNLDPATMLPVEKAPAKSYQPCPWVIAGSAVDLVSPVAIPILLGTRVAPVFRPANTALRAVLATGLPPATGPPPLV